MIIMYISAVFVAFLLRHQERIHYLELKLEYELLGKPMPMPKPKIPTLESWLNVLLGIFLILLGSLSLVTELIVMKDNLPVPREQFTFIAVVLATGITMVIFGIQSLQRNHQFAKNNSAQC
jgi:hypothetical protein